MLYGDDPSDFSLFLSNDPLSDLPPLSPTARSKDLLQTADDFNFFPFHPFASAASPNEGSLIEGSGSSVSSPPSSVASANGGGGGGSSETLLGGDAVEDLFAGVGGFELGSMQQGGWDGGFGASSWGQQEGGADRSLSSDFSADSNLSDDGQQQFKGDPFLSNLSDMNLDLGMDVNDLSAFASTPSSSAGGGYPHQQQQHQPLAHSSNQFLPTTAPGAGIPSFVLSHIENNPQFPSNSPNVPQQSVKLEPNAHFALPSQPPPAQPSTSSSGLLKRKASSPTPSSSSSNAGPNASGGSQGKLVSDHNAIERKYRDNIADAHLKLRDSVPVLRVLFKTSTHITQLLDTADTLTGLIDGQPQESKQGKATVLTAARDYIFLLQRTRAAERRYALFLEGRLGLPPGGAREEFNVLDRERGEEGDVYLKALKEGTLWKSFPHYSDQDDEGASAGPKKKKARASGAKAKAAGGKAGKEAGKVVLALGLGVGVGYPFVSGQLSTAATEVPVGGGRIVGRRLLTVVQGRTHAQNVLAFLALVVGVCLVVSVGRSVFWSVVRKRQERKEEHLRRALHLEEEGDEAGKGVSLKEALNVKSTLAVVGQLMMSSLGSAVGPSSVSEADVETKAWVRLAEQSLQIPTNLRTYLFLTLLTRHLSAALPTTSSPGSQKDLAKHHALLALLHHALAGNPTIPPTLATRHWMSARAADPDSEPLRLSLSKACTVGSVFDPSSSVSTQGALEKIAQQLVLRDLKAFWADVMDSLSPARSAVPSSPTTSVTSDSTLPKTTSTRSNPFAHLLDNPLSAPHRASLTLELEALERSTSQGTVGRQFAVVSRGVWAVMDRDSNRVKEAVVGLLGGEKLGLAAQELLKFVGIKPRISEDDDEVEPTNDLERELNLTLSFLLSYFTALRLLSPSSSATAVNKPLLSQTLHARSLLHQLDALAPQESDEDENDEEDSAREKFGTTLFAMGRWAVGWKADSDDDDSGFEECF